MMNSPPSFNQKWSVSIYLQRTHWEPRLHLALVEPVGSVFPVRHLRAGLLLLLRPEQGDLREVALQVQPEVSELREGARRDCSDDEGDAVRLHLSSGVTGAG